MSYLLSLAYNAIAYIVTSCHIWFDQGLLKERTCSAHFLTSLAKASVFTNTCNGSRLVGCIFSVACETRSVKVVVSHAIIVLGLSDREPAGFFVDYIIFFFFLFSGLYLIRIWLFSIMVLVIVEGQGRNSNWWVKAWSLSRWFTIRTTSSTLVIAVV